MNGQTFEEILQENEARIHFHIRRLGIVDPEGEFFAEGQLALWQAWRAFDPDRGSFSPYLNAKIRQALMDHIKRKKRDQRNDEVHMQQVLQYGQHITEMDIRDEEIWERVRAILSDNQWKWVHYYIIHDYSVEQIAAIEGVSRDAVKNWGRHARNKLRARLEA
ncbi:sigma-70 family RNA polymerase sigma factor [Halobacillus fulvus]|nr:sigma-70 family RNA polymerase sigma factor [Halobacillus fulvus]